MRKLLLAGFAALAAVGCQPTVSRAPVADNDWTLYADDAQIAAVDSNGNPWCAGLQIRVTATFAGKRIATPPAAGLTPSWHAPLETLPEADFARGIVIDVLAQCDGGGAPTDLGAVTLRADHAMIEAGGVQLQSFGSVESLRLDFVPAIQVEGPAPPYVAYAAGPDDGDDPVDVALPGACGSYDCGDDGDYPGDPGSATPDPSNPDDPGSDPGDDDGGDDGSDGTSKNKKRPPATQHKPAPPAGTIAQPAARLTP